jgi:hypothetical protein
MYNRISGKILIVGSDGPALCVAFICDDMDSAELALTELKRMKQHTKYTFFLLEDCDASIADSCARETSRAWRA